MKKDLDSTHIMQNGTGYQLRDALDSIAKSLKILAVTESANVDLTNYRHIQNIVQLGKAKEYFQIGDQIHTTWSPDGETEYDMPWDVVDFGPATDPDGNVHENAMWLESHYVVSGMMFDAPEAFYVAPESMPAGSYYFDSDMPLANTYDAGTYFQFTLSQEVPANGMLFFGTAVQDGINLPKRTLNDWRVRIYSDPAQETPSEVVTISIGSDGTYLGTVPFKAAGTDNMNNGYRTLGHNVWSESLIRQWLNSDAEDGKWWKRQNKFERDLVASNRGFIKGLPQEFNAIVKPIKLGTELNNYEFQANEYEVTNDRYFLPSLVSIGLQTSWLLNEGHIFAYYSNFSQYSDRIKYSITNNATKVGFYLRTAMTNTAANIACVTTSGGTAAMSAYVENGVAPVCVIY